MAVGSYNILGQKITVGGVNADTWFYRETLPVRCACYVTTPEVFDGIEAVRVHNGGAFPASDYTALYYSEDYGADPVFGIRVTYSGSKFNLSYGFRQNSGGVLVWTNSFVDHYYNDGYTGADPGDITSEDRWRQGIWFAYCEMGETFMPSTIGERWGFILQHNEIHPIEGGGFASGGYRNNLAPASFELKTGYPGDRYDWTGGEAYRDATDGRGNGYFQDGVGLVFDCFAKKIDDYTDDVSGPGGGYGTYQYFSRKVGIPALPGISIMDTGFATMWNPNPADCLSLNSYLWSDDFFDNIKKVNADPLANIIQFGVVPLNLSDLRGTSKEVKVGNVSTGVTMPPLTRQYIQVDLGSVNPFERWGTSMDYEPNTRATIFLPFVGMVDVPVSEIFGKEVNIVYNVDLLSGDFVAFIRIHKGVLDSVLYHKTGNMMLSFPISSANYASLYSTVAAGISGVVAGAATGNPGVIASSLGEMAGSIMSGGSSMQLNRTGNFSGASTALSCFEAYIVLTQPEQQMPGNYSAYVGYPSYITMKLQGDSTFGSCRGFTKVEAVIDNTVAATDEEKAMIETLLKEGVYL